MDLSVELDFTTFCVARFPPAIKLKSASVRVPKGVQGWECVSLSTIPSGDKALLLALGGGAEAVPHPIQPPWR